MSPRRGDFERIQDLLEGLTPPAEEAELRLALERRPELEREMREMAAVMSILRTPLDVAPPADLVPRVLAAVRMQKAARRWRLPARVENALVLAGSVGLAGVVAVLGRSAGLSGAEWLGRLVVASTRLMSFAKAAVVDLAEWDWAVRLLETLGRASATAVSSSALPFLSVSLVALAITALLGVLWLRGARSLRSGGFGHAHLLA
jgi:anti-sigma factor RsiW